jgi:hypothetical protein
MKMGSLTGVAFAGVLTVNVQAEWIAEEIEEPESSVSRPCPQVIISELPSRQESAEKVVFIDRDFRCLTLKASQQQSKIQYPQPSS